jgi:hypothetical protein
MISHKRRTIVTAMQQNNKDYSEFIPKALEDYIQNKFNCSPYLAKLCAQDLINRTNGS